mgnify:CR=1 FL=1
MSAVADKIMKRVRAKGRGWVFTPKHFIDFGTRGSVDMALSRLAQAGEIRIGVADELGNDTSYSSVYVRLSSKEWSAAQWSVEQRVATPYVASIPTGAWTLLRVRINAESSQHFTTFNCL